MAIFGSRTTAMAAQAAPRQAGPPDEALLALAKLAPARSLATGELVVPAGTADGSIWIVMDGCLAITGGEGETDTARFSRTDCLRVPSEAPGMVGSLVARQPSTVLTVSPALADRLPVTLQTVLWRAVATTSAAAARAAIERRAALETAASELGRLVAIREKQSRLCLESEVIRSIVSSIPKLPAYAVDLAGRLLADEAPVNDIVESIKGDPSLAALILKTVNSSYYGLRSKVSDYYRAFLLLGANAVYRLVLDTGLRSVLPDTSEGREIQTRGYVVSTIAAEIAYHSRATEPQLATTLGLLHNIGATVGLVLRKREPELSPFFALIDSAKLGADLLAAWGLPDRVFRTIEGQHLPEFTPAAGVTGDDAKAVTVLYVARVLADMALELDGHRTSTAYLGEHFAALGFRHDTPESLLRDRVLPALARQAKHLPRQVRDRIPGLNP